MNNDSVGEGYFQCLGNIKLHRFLDKYYCNFDDVNVMVRNLISSAERKVNEAMLEIVKRNEDHIEKELMKCLSPEYYSDFLDKHLSGKIYDFKKKISKVRASEDKKSKNDNNGKV